MVDALLDGRVTLHCGDCRAVLATLAPDSIDAVVTDPPYHLTSIVQRFGGEAPSNMHCNVQPENKGPQYKRLSAGFMGKTWDGGDIAFDPTTWAAVFRVLKPGGHLLAMGGTRTFHRLACAIEDAGFEIRDTISWLYGSGFPKSHDVSKGIDRAAGAEREADEYTGANGLNQVYGSNMGGGVTLRRGEPATIAARQWDGWGTALKPACELIVLARKPLSEKTVAANVLRWGTGAINVDGCRIEAPDVDLDAIQNCRTEQNGHTVTLNIPGHSQPTYNKQGRWPANVVHDGSDEVTAAFPDAGGGYGIRGKNALGLVNDDGWKPGVEGQQVGFGDSGSAARFFYTAKADADDRLGSKHPTVKPLDLMQWLVRLVTPKGGTVLDPFAGTGTTGEAAWREGAHAVLIEAEAEYQADIRRRMALALAGPDERSRESIKAKNLPRDDGPLFAESWAEMWAKPFDFSREPID